MTANLTDNSLGVLIGNGNGTFQAGVSYQVGLSPRTVRTGDFNNDGILDLTSADNLGGTTSILLGRGDGTFQKWSTSHRFSLSKH